MTGAGLPDETRPPRQGEELDPAVVSAFLSRELPHFQGQVRIAQFPGGASNLTYLVRAGEREWVLRRPPHGTKAHSAHDMGREYRILSRIHAAFPYAPRPVLFCGDPGVLGAEFYLMERLEGLILRRDLPETSPYNPRDPHALQDAEFYTDLADEIDEFSKLVRRIPKDRLREVFDLWTASSKGFIPRGDFGIAISPSRYFETLKRGNRAKWKKALGEFVRGI